MRRILCVVAFCALSTVSCTVNKAAMRQNPNMVPAAALGLQGKPTASSLAVDEYLKWLDQFVDARTEAIFKVEQDAKVRARNAALSAQSQPAPSASDMGPQLMRAMSDMNQSQQPLIAIYAQNANTFRQRTPPPECAQLANLYGSFLTKQATAAAATQAQMNKLMQSTNVPDGSQPPHDNGYDTGTPDDGSDDMLKANEELRRVYKTYPGLTTPGFILK